MHLATELKRHDPQIPLVFVAEFDPILREMIQAAIPTQTLGQLVYASGRFQAIRYPSARNLTGFCLAVFPDRIVSPAWVEGFDPYGELVGRLP